MVSTDSASQSLRCTIPPGWQQVDVPSMFAAIEQAAGPGRESAPLGILQKHLAAEGIVLVALRTRDANAILEFATVALPPEDTDAPDVTSDVGVAAVERSFVQLDSGPAIVHRDTPLGPDDTPRAAVVQLVVSVPPLGYGAIVTCISTDAGATELLEDAASAIAGSLAVELDAA